MISLKTKLVKSYSFSIVLVFSILLGGFAGYFFGKNVQWLKPLGDIFLNLIFTAIVPLVFFSVSSAIARTDSLSKLGKIIFYMTVVFIFTGVIAAVFAIVVVKLFPPAQNVLIHLMASEKIMSSNVFNQIANIFTVTSFAKLFSHENILALIIFSMLVGIAAAVTKEKGSAFIAFLQAGEAVFMRVFSLIMYLAPMGFFAYFAILVSELGPKLIESYARIAVTYYVLAAAYFVFVYTGYAYLAGKTEGIKLFWKNIWLPFTTAIATCSGAASIPANLVAAKEMHIAPEIYETVVPLGAIIHKDGSVIGGIIKIAFLFGIFHLDFSGASVLLIAVGVSLLVGTVMGAIPSGGMLGELLILNVYGFPPSALIAIAAISIIIDPPATMLNVTGNTISSMLISRLVEGKMRLRQS